MNTRPIFALIIGALQLACCNPVFADDVFYRVVLGGPELIFREGFQPWGSDRNLLAHVRGSNCNRDQPLGPDAADRSTYTSLSSTREAALRAARIKLERLAATPGMAQQTVWMYTIRPTRDMFSVVRTFELADQVLYQGPLRYPYQNALALDEWVAPQAVGPELIQEARQFRLEGGLPVEVAGSAVTNRAYVTAPAVLNTGGLPASVITGRPAASRTLRVLRAAAGTLSACWCDSPGRGATPRILSGDPAALCASQVEVINNVIPSVRYVPTNGWRVDLR